MPRVRRAGSGQGRWRLREVLILALAVLAPWAFGAVDGWAELALALGIAGVHAVGLFEPVEAGLLRRLTCAPSLALAGLALLAAVQSVPLPPGVLRVVAPAASGLRARLVPAVAERVAGDAGPVGLPPATLSRQPGASLDAACRLAAGWLLFQAVLGLGGASSYRRFALATSINGTLMALFFLAQALTWNGKVYWSFPSPVESAWMTGGPFIGHSHFAEYLNMALGLALGLLLTPAVTSARRGHWETRSWAVYAVGAMIVGLLASNSRGGVIALAAAGLATGLYGWLVSRRTRTGFAHPVGARYVGVIWALVTLGLIGLFLLVLGSTSPYLDRLATLADAEASGLTGRLELWHAALGVWRSQPFWGIGLGGFALTAQPSIWLPVPKHFPYAESEFVQILTEGGLVGMGLLLLAILGTLRLALRAFRATTRDAWLILGGAGGGLALLIQCVGDFGLHVPGVSVTALVLAAHLCRLGLRAPALEVAEADRPRGVWTWRVGTVGRVAACGLALVIAARALDLTRAEALLAAADVPLPGTLSLSPAREPAPREVLEDMRDALTRVTRLRPDWAEGHARLGLIELCLYEQTVGEWLLDGAPDLDAAGIASLADPLHLLDLAHATGDQAVDPASLAEQGPVRDYLAPAARAFLEARRCCLVLALAHAEVASLDYLLVRGEPGPAHARRAYETATDFPTQMFTAQVAARLGDTPLAARCWRKALEAFGPNWAEIAEAAAATLPPDRILAEVASPGGRYPLLFAERLFTRPDQREDRERFLRTAITRLREDQTLEPAERTWLEGVAWADLDEPRHARDLMEAALAARPFRSEWRAAFVGRLLDWGLPQEAHKQALTGLQMAPEDPALRQMRQATVDALARGSTRPEGR